MDQWKRTVLPLVTMFTAIMLDGTITVLFKEQLDTQWGLIVPRLSLLLLIVFAFYLRPGHLVFLSLLFGFLYDSYYTGYLGIYMASFSLIIYLVLQLRNLFQTNVLIYTLLSIIMVTILEFFLYGVYQTLGIATMSFQLFLAERLGATLIFNGIVMLAFSYFFDKFIQFIVRTEERKYKQKV